MAELPILQRLKALTDNLSNRLKLLGNLVNDAGGFIGLSLNNANKLEIDTDGTLLYVERTADSLKAILNALANTNFLTDAERASIAQIGDGSVNLTEINEAIIALQDAVKTTINVGEISDVSIADSFNNKANIAPITINPTGITVITATVLGVEKEWIFTGGSGQYGGTGKIAFEGDFFGSSGGDGGGIDFTTDSSLNLDPNTLILRANISEIPIYITDYLGKTINFPLPVTKILYLSVNNDPVHLINEIVSRNETSVTLNYFEDIPPNSEIYALVQVYSTQPAQAFNAPLTEQQVRAIFDTYAVGGDLDTVALRGATSSVALTAPGFKTTDQTTLSLLLNNATVKPLAELATAQSVNEILTLLATDDITLDELQEVVTYIKANRSDLANLSIPNIAGLVAALAGKVDNDQVLTDVPEGAVFTDNDTVYTHPENHSPSIISQNATNRFVTDAEKSTWNGKETPAGAQSKANTAEQNANDYADSLGSSLLSKSFTYNSGAQTFTADFEIVQVDTLLVGNTPLQRNSQYSVSGAVVTILDTLTSGAVIELNYWKANAVNATNYTKAESDALFNKTDVISTLLSGAATDLIAGDTETFEAPYDFTLNNFWIAVTTAPTGSNLVVDVKKAGVSITSTKASIESNEYSSLTGTAPVLTTNSFVKGDKITPNISQVGSLETGKSLKIYLEITKI